MGLEALAMCLLVVQDAEGFTALHKAAVAGHMRVSRTLTMFFCVLTVGSLVPIAVTV